MAGKDDRGDTGVLVEQLDALDLTVEETRTAEVKDEELQFAVVAKVLARRPVNYRAMVSTLGEVWGTSNSMKNRKIGTNMFLFSFSLKRDMNHVLKDGPWSFNDRPLLVTEYDGTKRPSDLEFNTLPIWIRVFDLPLSLMNNRAAKTIGAMFGEVVEIDSDRDGCGWGEYLRIRALLDVSKPLRRGVLIKSTSSKDPRGDWYVVKYEKLPHFCFHCGIVGFQTCDCEEKSNSDSKTKYSEELRVTLGRREFLSNHKKMGERDDDGRGRKDADKGAGAEENSSNGISRQREEKELEKERDEGDVRGDPKNGEGKDERKMEEMALVVSDTVRSDATAGVAKEMSVKAKTGGTEKKRKYVRKVKLKENFADENRMEIEGDANEDVQTKCVKRKRSLQSDHNRAPNPVGSEGDSDGTEATGPTQKRRKEGVLRDIMNISATVATQQPRREQ